MKVVLRFYTELSRWYVDLPEWKGLKEELEMVEGADLLLEFICGGAKETLLTMSDEPFEGADILTLKSLGDPNYAGGAYYTLEHYDGHPLDLMIWLCPVTLFVFEDGYPETIYFREVD